MQKDILIKWYFPHPPEDVWECLANPVLVNQWFMKNDFKPEEGHRFQFHSKPVHKMGWDGVVYCEVLKVIPNQLLSYCWNAGPAPGIINLETVLTWTLEAKDIGTQLTLEHTGFKGFKNYITGLLLEKGWKGKVAKKFGGALNQYIHDKINT